MFWNDPNLYSVAFKDVPNIPNPFWGQAPRHFNPYFTPPVTPFMHTNPVLPWLDRTMTPYNYNNPYFGPYGNPTPFTPPVTPFMHTNPVLPWLDRTMIPYNYNNPYFGPYGNPTPFTPPVTPGMNTNPALPWLDRTMTPYNYNLPLPYFQAYRPFGL